MCCCVGMSVLLQQQTLKGVIRIGGLNLEPDYTVRGRWNAVSTLFGTVPLISVSNRPMLTKGPAQSGDEGCEGIQKLAGNGFIHSRESLFGVWWWEIRNRLSYRKIRERKRERWETSPPSPFRWRMTSPCCCDAYEGLHNNSKTSIGHRRMGLEWIMLIRKRISNLTQSLASGSRWSYRCTIASEGKNKVVENVRLFNGPLLRVRLSTEWLVMFGSVSRG